MAAAGAAVTPVAELRATAGAVRVRVRVIEVWEGGAFLAGDASGSLRFVGGAAGLPGPAAGAAPRALAPLEVVDLQVELQKGCVAVLRELPAAGGAGESEEGTSASEEGKDAATDSAPPAAAAPTAIPPPAPLVPLESCGVLVVCGATRRVLAVRDYHSPAFMDVQFKLRAAFDGRIPALPLPALLAHVAQWTDAELGWIAEWRLASVWPYASAERIRGWNAAMKALDPQIKTLYRAAKDELARRREAGRSVANTSWGFPKGGLKVVRGRVESTAEAAARELHEETGLRVDASALGPHHDIPRAHGHTFDRWFVHRAREEQPQAPPPGSWDVAALAWLSVDALLAFPHLARFGPVLRSLAAGQAEE